MIGRPAAGLLTLLLVLASCRKDEAPDAAAAEKARAEGEAKAGGEAGPEGGVAVVPPLHYPGRITQPARIVVPYLREARNQPPLAEYVANRHKWIDKVVTLRVRATPGEYFNCYYKGRQTSYHHVKLRGDGSAYLDGYVPRDEAGEKLWEALQAGKPLELTVKVIMRRETFSGVCLGQVDVIGHRRGWDFSAGPLGDDGVAVRRIGNSRDRLPALNEPSIEAFVHRADAWVGKKVTLRVRARLIHKYGCRYTSAERTHYAFELMGDGFRKLRAYFPRSPRGERLAAMLARDEGRRLTVTVTVPEGRFDELCPEQVELVAWRAGWAGAEAPEIVRGARGGSGKKKRRKRRRRR